MWCGVGCPLGNEAVARYHKITHSSQSKDVFPTHQVLLIDFHVLGFIVTQSHCLADVFEPFEGFLKFVIN